MRTYYFMDKFKYFYLFNYLFFYVRNIAIWLLGYNSSVNFHIYNFLIFLSVFCIIVVKVKLLRNLFTQILRFIVT